MKGQLKRIIGKKLGNMGLIYQGLASVHVQVPITMHCYSGDLSHSHAMKAHMPMHCCIITLH